MGMGNGGGTASILEVIFFLSRTATGPRHLQAYFSSTLVLRLQLDLIHHISPLLLEYRP